MEMETLKSLFSPIKINTMVVENRIFMPPMCTDYATIKGEVTDRLIAYYVERAKGGAGLITVEFTSVHPKGKVFEHMTGIYDDGMIPGYKELTDAVHKAGAKIAVQLSHAGRRSHSSIIGEVPVAPSPIPRLNGEVPRELRIEEIRNLVQDYARAAGRARKGGFDAVVIHMAHGYLIHQFLSPLSNRRQDEYGGDPDKRSRFAIEILREVRNELGKDFPITARVCGDEYLPGGLDLAQSKTIAKKLEENGIDAIDVSAGTHETNHITLAPSSVPPGFLVHLSAGIKEVVQVPVGIVGRIHDPVLAETILTEKKADFVSVGRGLIADPELPIKALEGRIEEIRPCTSCNLGCADRMYKQLDISCMVNPMVGREIDFRIEPASERKRVLIVGGGPGGLETARVAALRGHEVFLYEREKRLGGQLNLAKIPPGKAEFGKLVAYYEHQMKMLKVRIVHEDVNKEKIKKVKPDVLVIATGGKPNIPVDLVINSNLVCTAWEVLKGKNISGQKVVVVGGGLIGCETAEVLLDQGKKITILEMLDTVAADMSPRARKFLLDKLVEGSVEIIKDAIVQEISKTEIKYERAGLKQKIKGFDHAVLAIGTAPERTLLNTLGKINIPVFSIGDCQTPRRTMEAIREGFDLAIEL